LLTDLDNIPGETERQTRRDAGGLDRWKVGYTHTPRHRCDALPKCYRLAYRRAPQPPGALVETDANSNGEI
jgi:hypothetical protein